MHVSKLSKWHSIGKEYFNKGLDSLAQLALFISGKKTIISSQRVSAKSTEAINEDALFDLFFDAFSDEEIETTVSAENEIKIEKNLFLSKLSENNFDFVSSRQFWIENSTKMPILADLALLLLNIPSSSAFIERFFSICGAICNKRSGNYSDDMIILRSFLKANMNTLQNMIL